MCVCVKQCSDAQITRDMYSKEIRRVRVGTRAHSAMTTTPKLPMLSKYSATHQAELWQDLKIKAVESYPRLSRIHYR
jgi:hypothetical protein